MSILFVFVVWSIPRRFKAFCRFFFRKCACDLGFAGWLTALLGGRRTYSAGATAGAAAGAGAEAATGGAAGAVAGADVFTSVFTDVLTDVFTDVFTEAGAAATSNAVDQPANPTSHANYRKKTPEGFKSSGV